MKVIFLFLLAIFCSALFALPFGSKYWLQMPVKCAREPPKTTEAPSTLATSIPRPEPEITVSSNFTDKCGVFHKNGDICLIPVLVNHYYWKKFSINVSSSVSDDVALQMEYHPDQRIFSFNTFSNGSWGIEETMNDPLSNRETALIIIQLTQDGIKITFDLKFQKFYQSRVDIAEFDLVEARGLQSSRIEISDMAVNFWKGEEGEQDVEGSGN